MEANRTLYGHYITCIPKCVWSACENCPVRYQCIREAVENEELGLWGGTSVVDRKRIRRYMRRNRETFSLRILKSLGIWDSTAKNIGQMRIRQFQLIVDE